MNPGTFPLDKGKINQIIKDCRVDIENASIRQVNMVVHEAEKILGVKFVRMEFGIPGLPADRRAFEKEHEAVTKMAAASTYPPFNGTEAFRKASSKFIKMFANIDIPESCIVATCGAQQGAFLSQAVCGRVNPKKRHVVFIDPGFSVSKLQTRFLDMTSSGIDIYERETFLKRLEARLEKGDVCAVLWSSPNNPSWAVLTEEELREMGRLFTKHDVIAIEDDAYFGLDFRIDYSKPGVPPFVPSVANYTDNYILLFSASKIFNYAGQRIGWAAISPRISNREYPNLEKCFAVTRFIDAIVQGGIYPTTSGVVHSSQVAVAHLMDEASSGRFNFLLPLKVYGERAKFYKSVMLKNGFELVYAMDGAKPLADGFYFTVAYPNMSGPKLLEELLYYGISVTTLNTFGSTRTDGIRICVSLEGEKSYKTFTERIEAFAKYHK